MVGLLRYYYYKPARRLTAGTLSTPKYYSRIFKLNVSDNAINIENMPGRTFCALNRIFSKPDNAIHMENKPGRTFRALNCIFFKCGRIFFKFFAAKK